MQSHLKELAGQLAGQIAGRWRAVQGHMQEQMRSEPVASLPLQTGTKTSTLIFTLLDHRLKCRHRLCDTGPDGLVQLMWPCTEPTYI